MRLIRKNGTHAGGSQRKLAVEFAGIVRNDSQPCFPPSRTRARKREREREREWVKRGGCPRELRARRRYNIQRRRFFRMPLTGTHCIKVYPRFFLIIIAFVDNGPGIICYREMSWSRNFLNYFVPSDQLFFPPPFTPSSPDPLTLRVFLSVLAQFPALYSFSPPLSFSLYTVSHAKDTATREHRRTFTHETVADIFLTVILHPPCSPPRLSLHRSAM